ncbi:inositol monophosphatase [Variovorax sp. E3]|uniref:inositol monophosphatase family protein n=1 Tax=Variovorax sp. E3 TaxID=1914993 RepID=UPI0018DB1885
MRPKGPQDFVSAADEKVEQLIRARLALDFFGDAVIGEECGGRPSANATWFIDPIDGTSNFLRGLPLWGVSLGLVRDGKPSIGVIAFPALDLIVGAETGFGLFVNGRAAQPQRPFSDVHLASVATPIWISRTRWPRRADCARRGGWWSPTAAPRWAWPSARSAASMGICSIACRPGTLRPAWSCAPKPALKCTTARWTRGRHGCEPGCRRFTESRKLVGVPLAMVTHRRFRRGADGTRLLVERTPSPT